MTKPHHPWLHGQIERMNRTLKDATVKRYHYETDEQLTTHLQLSHDAYDHAKHLKTLKGLPPTSPSAKQGPKSQNASYQIRQNTPWD